MAKEQVPLATVNGNNIYASDIDELIAMLPPQQQIQFSGRQQRRELLDELVNQELFYFEALEKGLDKTEEFQKLVEDATRKLIKSQAMTDFLATVDIPDEEIKEYYDQNPDQFIAPESISASHILLDDELLAKKIIKDLQDGTITFEEAAKQYSSCPSKEQGGNLGYFQHGQMVPEFEQAAFALDTDEITPEPVKTQFGYHIIRKNDLRKDETIPYDIVKDSLKNFLLMQKQDQALKEHAKELRDKYPVEINLGMV